MFRKAALLLVLITLLANVLPARADGSVTLGLGTLTSMALSPDGARLAVGTTIGVYFYDAQTFAPQGFWGTDYVVDRVLWSPQGSMIALIRAQDDQRQQIEIRDVSNSTVLWSLTGEPCSLCRWRWAFSPDGLWLAVAEVNRVDVFDAANGALLKSLASGSALGYRGAAFSPDGRLAACCADGYTQVWDVPTVQVTRLLHTLSDPVAWSSRGQLLTLNGTIWDVERQRSSGYVVNRETIDSATFSRDGWIIATGGGYGVVRLWSTQDAALLNVLVGHQASVVDVTFSPDGQTLYSAGDNAVRAWAVNTGKELRLLEGFSPASRHVAWSADGRRIFSNENEQLVAANVVTRLPETAITLPRSEICADSNPDYCYHYRRPIADMVTSPAGDVVAVASRSGITLYDSTTLRFLHRLPTNYAVFSLAFSPDGKYIVSGGDSPYVIIWETATGQLHRSFPASPEKSYLVALAFSGSGQTLYSLDGSGVFQQWGFTSGTFAQMQIPDTIHGYGLCWYNFPPSQTELFRDNCGYQVGAAAISPAVGRVAIEHGDGIAVVDMATGQTLYLLVVSDVRAVAIAAQGTHLAAAVGNTVMIWKLDTGELVAEYKGHTGLVNDVAFSPDGRSLASGSRDGTIRIWAVP